jgi:hypothetical protein
METAVAWTAEAKIALGRLGMGESHLLDLAVGEPVAFILSGAAEGTIAVAQFTAEGRLRVGIYTIKNVGGGLDDFMMFEARAQAAASALGAKELELIAIEITNPQLRSVLERGGFAPTTMPVPVELGGGIFNAISRIEPVQETEEQTP